MKFQHRRQWLTLGSLGALLAAIGIGILASNATAQSPAASAPTGKTLSYAAKFTCGLMPQGNIPLDPKQALAAFPRELPLKPANYATDVNVHNPQVQSTVLWKKAVLSAWVGIQPGTNQIITSEFEQPFDGGTYITVQLKADGAFTVDCQDIVKKLVPPGAPPFASFVTGFVVINSPVELDVTAVYTSERQDAPVVYCLLSDGQVVTGTSSPPPATGTQCPPPNAASVSTIGVSATQAGTGLTMDVVSVEPKSVKFPGHDATGTNPN